MVVESPPGWVSNGMDGTSFNGGRASGGSKLGTKILARGSATSSPRACSCTPRACCNERSRTRCACVCVCNGHRGERTKRLPGHERNPRNGADACASDRGPRRKRTRRPWKAAWDRYRLDYVRHVCMRDNIVGQIDDPERVHIDFHRRGRGVIIERIIERINAEYGDRPLGDNHFLKFHHMLSIPVLCAIVYDPPDPLLDFMDPKQPTGWSDSRPRARSGYIRSPRDRAASNSVRSVHKCCWCGIPHGTRGTPASGFRTSQETPNRRCNGMAPKYLLVIYERIFRYHGTMKQAWSAVLLRFNQKNSPQKNRDWGRYAPK